MQFAALPALDSQAGPGGAPQTASQTRTVSGTVVNSVTGRPIARALVQTGDHAMLTDGEGHFEFSDVTDTVVSFATKPGYSSEAGAMVFDAAAVRDDAPLELQLVPDAVISGHVTDGQGAPLEGVQVSLRRLMVENGLKHWQQRNSTTTNAEGEFRFAELQAGEYAVESALKLDGPPEGEAAAGYAPAAFPEIGVGATGALQVHAGDQSTAELSTHLERLYRVSGVVTGLPPGAAVHLSARTENGSEVNAGSRVNAQTGEFHVLLPSGSFELRAEAYMQPQIPAKGVMIRGRAVDQLVARRLVTVGQGPVNGVRMALEPPATVAIEVIAEKVEKAEPTGRFATPDDPAQMNFDLLAAEPDASRSMYSSNRGMDQPGAEPGAQKDGPLLIRDLQPGRYFLQERGQLSWYIAAASCGGTDLTREPLAIAGGTGCTMHVVLRNDTASLKVAVTDPAGGHAARLLIYALPLNNSTRDVQMFATGGDGTARLDAMAPGQYLLLAVRHDASLAFRDAESMHRYESEGRRVDLSPGANPDVQLDLIAGEP